MQRLVKCFITDKWQRKAFVAVQISWWIGALAHEVGISLSSFH